VAKIYPKYTTFWQYEVRVDTQGTLLTGGIKRLHDG